jgi:hypothetical protein
MDPDGFGNFLIPNPTNIFFRDRNRFGKFEENKEAKFHRIHPGNALGYLHFLGM